MLTVKLGCVYLYSVCVQDVCVGVALFEYRICGECIIYISLGKPQQYANMKSFFFLC